MPEDELDDLVNEVMSLRSIDKKEFYDLAESHGTQVALEKFALREYSRKKLGRKLTDEEKEQRKSVENWKVVKIFNPSSWTPQYLSSFG